MSNSGASRRDYTVVFNGKDWQAWKYQFLAQLLERGLYEVTVRKPARPELEQAKVEPTTNRLKDEKIDPQWYVVTNSDKLTLAAVEAKKMWEEWVIPRSTLESRAFSKIITAMGEKFQYLV